LVTLDVIKVIYQMLLNEISDTIYGRAEHSIFVLDSMNEESGMFYSNAKREPLSSKQLRQQRKGNTHSFCSYRKVQGLFRDVIKFNASKV
jgi:hypothetical protein